MIPMPVAPYDGINLLLVHTTLAQNLVDIFGDVEARDTILN